MIAVTVRRRWSLLLHVLTAFVTTVLVGAFLWWVVESDWPSVRRLFNVRSSSAYPALRLALAVSAVSVLSPHLSRPLRYFGRWLTFFAVIAGYLLGVCRPWGIPAGLALGIGVARPRSTWSSVRPVAAPRFPRCGGRSPISAWTPSPGPADLRGAGVSVVSAVEPDGTALLLKVYGRDAGMAS